MERLYSQASKARFLFTKCATVALLILLPIITGCLENAETPQDQSSGGGGTGFVSFGVTDPSASAEETGGGNKIITINFSLSGPAPSDLTLYYSTEDISAQSGADYVDVSNQSILVPEGQQAGTVTVNVIRDSLHENVETFRVRFLSVDPAFDTLNSDLEAVVTITDDDAAPVIRFATGPFVNDEEEQISVRVELTAVSGRDTTFDFRTVDTVTPAAGEAEVTKDYVSIPVTSFSIDAGDSYIDIPVQSIYDELNEIDEAINVEISNPSGATLGTATSQAVIQDVTGYPGVYFELAEKDAYESSGTVTVKVKLDRMSGRAVTVPVILSVDETSGGQHNATATYSVPIAKGALEGQFSFNVFDDLIAEQNKDLVFAFDSRIDSATGDAAFKATNGVQSSTSLQTHTVHIRESDTLPESLSNLVDKDMGIKLNGPETYGYAGLTVCGPGDINNDGKDDVFVHHRSMSAANGGVYDRQISVLYGSDTLNSNVELGMNLQLSGKGWQHVFGGDSYSYDNSSEECGALGDVVGNGKNAFYTKISDQSYIFDGRANIPPGTQLWSNTSPTYSVSMTLGASSALPKTGDFDGDGVNEFVASIYNFNHTNVYSNGLTYAFNLSPATSSLNLFSLYCSNTGSIDPDIRLCNLNPGISIFYNYFISTNSYGYQYSSSAGDFDGDGIDDYVLFFSGKQSLFYGSTSPVSYTSWSTPNANVLSGSPGIGVSIDGIGSNNYTFKPVRGTGDLDGDGYYDVVGAYGGSTDKILSIVFGRSGRSTSLITVTTADANSHRRYISQDPRAMIRAIHLGDINLDGYDDFAYNSEDDLNPIETVTGLGESKGAIFIMWGSARSDFSTTTDLDYLQAEDLPANNNVRRVSKITGEELGNIISDINTAGDINNDGAPDIIVGAYNAMGVVGNAGAAYVIWGGDLTNAITNTNYDSTANTLNGSGSDDVLFGAAGDDMLTSGNAGDDVLYGGTGDDTIELEHENFLRIDGGAGNDTLILMGTNLDLTAIGPAKFKNIEVIDLQTDPSAQTVDLAAADVYKTNELADIIYIDCSANDIINVTGSDWSPNGTLGAYSLIKDNNSRAQIGIDGACTVNYP